MIQADSVYVRGSQSSEQELKTSPQDVVAKAIDNNFLGLLTQLFAGGLLGNLFPQVLPTAIQQPVESKEPPPTRSPEVYVNNPPPPKAEVARESAPSEIVSPSKSSPSPKVTTEPATNEPQTDETSAAVTTISEKPLTAPLTASTPQVVNTPENNITLAKPLPLPLPTNTPVVHSQRFIQTPLPEPMPIAPALNFTTAPEKLIAPVAVATSKPRMTTSSLTITTASALKEELAQAAMKVTTPVEGKIAPPILAGGLNALQTLLGKRFNGFDGLSPNQQLPSPQRGIMASDSAALFARLGDRIGPNAERPGSVSKLPASQQAQILERIQKAVETAAKGRNPNSLVVRLDPPELGAMTVKLTKRGEQLFARLSADSTQVESVLRERLSEITQLLQSAGFKAEDIHLSIGRERSDGEAALFGNLFGERQSKEAFYNRAKRADSAVTAEVEQPKMGSERANTMLSSWVA